MRCSYRARSGSSPSRGSGSGRSGAGRRLPGGAACWARVAAAGTWRWRAVGVLRSWGWSVGGLPVQVRLQPSGLGAGWLGLAGGGGWLGGLADGVGSGQADFGGPALDGGPEPVTGAGCRRWRRCRPGSSR